MRPYALIDLHCDTLTDCMYAGSNIIDTLDDPARTLSLTSIPKDIHWAQFFAVFVPDELRGEKATRFWMTFGQEYLTHLRVIQNIGMARIDEVDYNGVKIVPLQFLKAVLPNPQDLGENYEGETSIGCRIRGVKDGKELTYYVYNNCSHHAAYLETGMQGVSYTTGVPAMIGAMMFLKGIWKKPGVWNVEEFDPDPFMEELNKDGLPWHEVFNGDLEL